MQQYRRLLFPALALCFLLVMGGYFLGRRSADGVILTTQRTPEITETAAVRLLPSPSSQAAEGGDGRLDLNKATLEELMELPGIGEVRAQRILDYRAEHGPFQLATELMNVNGIGEGIFAELRELVYVEESHEDTDH